jgi:hypothetical protein
MGTYLNKSCNPGRPGLASGLLWVATSLRELSFFKYLVSGVSECFAGVVF